ncbi:conserved hypothetical protein [Neospora caninum Liverpool]|uniref:Uncharacterized protein n=1 Tax=Neospora caninum (strain Liverpool) TaxID=572307 RepID=F0VBG1_NEOCL|nr:conserved hypothetical protein [Neospora caninum Liverpool]CBZ50945.1 conserved hypothetical protein [Neospora caninum Liverpool]CEL68246.1 TPA: hypothetical protein BN1204_040200 [Neospora caninum Liverpool]|eukprot:XP_003880978.1 conserved hypothetical protein [Neospora caninum Liverpool]
MVSVRLASALVWAALSLKAQGVVQAASPVRPAVAEEPTDSPGGSVAEGGERFSIEKQASTLSIPESLSANSTSTFPLPDEPDVAEDYPAGPKDASEEAPHYQDLSLSEGAELFDRKTKKLQTGKARHPRLRGHAQQAYSGKLGRKGLFSQNEKSTDHHDEEAFTHKKDRKREHATKSVVGEGKNVLREDEAHTRLSALSKNAGVPERGSLARKRRPADTKLFPIGKTQSTNDTQNILGKEKHRRGTPAKNVSHGQSRGKEQTVGSKISAAVVEEKLLDFSSEADATREETPKKSIEHSTQLSGSNSYVDRDAGVHQEESTGDIEFLIKKAVRGAALNAVIIQYLVDEARKGDTDTKGLLEQQVNNLNSLAVKFMKFNRDMKEAVDNASDNPELQTQLVTYWLNHIIAQQLVIFRTLDPAMLKLEPKLTQSHQPSSSGSHSYELSEEPTTKHGKEAIATPNPHEEYPPSATKAVLQGSAVSTEGDFDATTVDSSSVHIDNES